MSERDGPTDESGGEPEDERRNEVTDPETTVGSETGSETATGPKATDDPERTGGPETTASSGASATDRAHPDAVTQEELDALQERLERFEDEIDERTVHRAELESDLKRYVRSRNRRGHARGWGPYLVLLYGTAMTLGAFYFLDGGWAVFAMIVIWLSTLGLYTLMVLVGLTFTALGIPGRILDAVRSLR